MLLLLYKISSLKGIFVNLFLKNKKFEKKSRKFEENFYFNIIRFIFFIFTI